MAISYQQIRNLPARAIIRALFEDRFSLRRQEGSHQRYVRVTVTMHKPSDPLPIKTLKSIVESQARWSRDDLLRLRLMR